jgi:hypothetical protein
MVTGKCSTDMPSEATPRDSALGEHWPSCCYCAVCARTFCCCCCCGVCAQAIGQLTYIRPYVTDFSPEWLFGSSMSLVAGAMALIYVAGAQWQLIVPCVLCSTSCLWWWLAALCVFKGLRCRVDTSYCCAASSLCL